MCAQPGLKCKLAGLERFTSLLQRYQAEGQKIILPWSNPHPSRNALLALSNKSKYHFFSRRKRERKILTELAGKGSSEHRNCPAVTSLLPSLCQQHWVPTTPTSAHRTLSHQDLDSSLQQINKCFLNIPKYLYPRAYLSGLPHMALSYPVLIWVSGQDWIRDTKRPVTPLGHSGPEFF